MPTIHIIPCVLWRAALHDGLGQQVTITRGEYPLCRPLCRLPLCYTLLTLQPLTHLGVSVSSEACIGLIEKNNRERERETVKKGKGNRIGCQVKRQRHSFCNDNVHVVLCCAISRWFLLMLHFFFFFFWGGGGVGVYIILFIIVRFDPENVDHVFTNIWRQPH